MQGQAVPGRRRSWQDSVKGISLMLSLERGAAVVESSGVDATRRTPLPPGEYLRDVPFRSPKYFSRLAAGKSKIKSFLELFLTQVISTRSRYEENSAQNKTRIYYSLMGSIIKKY
jgi:hypothetical protein